MESAAGTASLRNAAAHWSLAGDKQLLDLLQNLHERIVNQCQETNSSLEEMVNSLDTASISLQNVNNRLMALSNSQFVESRVYDDDVDVATRDPPVKEPPKTKEPTTELSKLRDSLRVLESYHEPVLIVDSDSDSATDEEEDRMVFKPKDLYADRPLPYIIGSQQWRSKWHAGLVVEDSDTDSDTSKPNPPSEQYSDSEPDGGDPQMDKPHASQRTISTNSSIGSELTIPAVGKPADIAAELARRLGGNVPHIPEPEPESPPVAAASTKVYRPQQPSAATIFSDEPPPLDSYQSDHSDQPYQSGSEDDVFAELHKNTPHRQTERSAGGVADQLFGNVSNVYGRKGGYENDVDRGRQPNRSAKQPSPLFEEPQDSELFVDRIKCEQQSDAQPETSMKKPVGGISLFGNNQGAESIGAAILKRNQRKVSTSDDEIEEPQQISKVNNYIEKNNVKAETERYSTDKIQKDIINDLFSKSNKTKQTNNKVEKISAVHIEKPINKKVDLFTDDLFDDIDDIFTNVKPPIKETKDTLKKSLFDDDDDDLFANVAASSNKSNSKPESKNKSIFDSDDDLFNEENLEHNSAKLRNDTKLNKLSVNISNDRLFSEKRGKIDKVPVETVIETKTDRTITETEKSNTIWQNDHKDNTCNVNDPESKREEVKRVDDKSLIKCSKVKSIFDSDSDDDIFSDLKSEAIKDYDTQKSKTNIKHYEDNKTKPHTAVDKDNITTTDPVSISDSKNNECKVVKEKNELGEDDSLFKQIEKPLDGAEEFFTPHILCNNPNINIGVDQLEDNNKKTDQVLTECRDGRTQNESNVIICAEGNLLSSKKSILRDANVPKTQFRSPSLFDEDDNLDDIFTKSPDSNKSKVGQTLEKSNSDKSPQFTINKDINSDSNFLLTKENNEFYSEIIKESDDDIASNKSTNLTQNVIESQIFKLNKTEALKFENNKPEVFKNSRDLNQTDTNLVDNSLQESGVPLPTDENFVYSTSIPKESMREEKKENKTDNDNLDNSDIIQKESLFFDTKESFSNEPDLFSDIFNDMPPEFERPKEPKKSKNVNALFDDDSDDEALFFKKNEIITDEKPDVSFTSQDDRLFHIFHDEPPAMDVDFTQKPKKTLDSDLEIPSGETYSEIISSQSNICERMNVPPLFGEEKQKEPRTFVEPEPEINIDKAKKPIGKLKPMNFNINVNTLLPGASPKKTKTYERNEQVDGQVISIKSTEDVVKDESKIVKSVSFEGEPESEVLDNKLSKERAKIQVKRRPSSRRARKEAVRKSGIYFGDDSTDNFISTHVSKKDSSDKTIVLQSSSNSILTNEKQANTTNKENVIVNKGDDELRNSNNTEHNKITDASRSNLVFEKQLKSDLEQESKLFSNVETNIPEHTIDSDTSSNNIIRKEISENSNLTTAFNKKPHVKSRVVYILNDEDIFTDTKPVTNLIEDTQNIAKKKVLNIVDDDDELFKSSTSRNTNIATLGKVYKEVNLKNNEIDNFDSNEDIFKASQKSVKNNEVSSKSSNDKNEIDKLEANIDKLFVKTQSIKAKSLLFDDLSGDENELFGSKKNVKNPNTADNIDGISTMIKKEIILPKSNVKRPLFGDESDDDDLFSVRTTKKEPPQPLSKPKEVTSKPTEPVFEDPLSILRQEDDM